MMDMSTMPSGIMTIVGLYHLAIFVFSLSLVCRRSQNPDGESRISPLRDCSWDDLLQALLR